MTKSKMASIIVAAFVLVGGVSFAASQAGEDALLSQSWTTMQTASLYKRYERQNPLESARLEAYWANGGTVPAVATAFGRALLLEAQAYWSLRGPAGDTTPPTVSLTAPTNGTTVSGTINVSATAADNVGVTKVEFYRDSSNLFATDTTSPYAATFDTTTVTNGQHTFGARAYDAAGNSTSSAAVTVTVTNASPPPGSVTLTPVDGGTNYYSQFTNPLSNTTIPIGVWFESVIDQNNVDLDKDVGINLYVVLTASSNLGLVRSNGMRSIIQASERTRFTGIGTETAGWELHDEIDMQCGPPCDGYGQLEQILAGLPADGRARYNNYGKGVMFWETDAQAATFINGRSGPNSFQQLVSNDVYWFTDPGGACSAGEGGQLLKNGQALTQAECRRASNYGAVVEKMRRLDAMDGKRMPVWNFVEVGHPFTESDAPTITGPQIRAAVWHSFIAGARGILYFNHNFGGSCISQHVLRDSCGAAVRPTVKAVNTQIQSLASVLNSPTVTSGLTANANVKAMGKWDGSNFYVFAGSANNTSSSGTFAIPCVGTATATVVGENRTVPVNGGSWTDSFADGNAVHIYRIDGGGRCGL